MARLGTLVAYLDRLSGPARDELVLPHGLHASSGFGMLGGV